MDQLDRVHGKDSLYGRDGPILPAVDGVNPSFTISATSQLACDRTHEKLESL